MKITGIEMIPLANVPIQPPPFRKEPSRGRVTLLRIDTDEGVVGWSQVGAGYGAGLSLALIAAFVKNELEPTLVGENPLLVEHLWHRMMRTYVQRGASAWGPVIGAIDVALWDIKGKVLGQPVYMLLGGAQDAVEAYVSWGVAGPNSSQSHLPRYSTEELVEEAKHLVAQGHTKLKTIVMRDIPRDPDEHAARIGAVREGVGPNVKLMVDGNANFSLHESIRFTRLCEPHDITFFEDPIARNDARLLAELRQHTSIPLAANPGGFRWAYRELLLHNSVDFLMPNVSQIGYTEAAKIAEMALAFDRPIANGNGSGPHNMHLIAGFPNGWGVEFHYHGWMTYNAIYRDMPGPQNGWLTIPQTPGLGLDPKPEVVAEYRQPLD